MQHNLTHQGIVNIRGFGSKIVKKPRGIKLYNSKDPLLENSNIPSIAINHNQLGTFELSSTELNMKLDNDSRYKIAIDIYYRAQKSQTDTKCIERRYLFSTCKSNKLDIPHENYFGYITYVSPTKISITTQQNNWYKVVINSIEKVNIPTNISAIRRDCYACKLNTSPKLTFTEINKSYNTSGRTCPYIIKYADGIWVSTVYSVQASEGLLYSEDGKNWNNSNCTIPARSINYGNGLWIACLSSNIHGPIAYSEDGKNWSYSDFGTNATFYGDYAFYANNMWVCSTEKGLYYSTNGKSWTKCTLASGINKEVSPNTINYANGSWITTSPNLYSEDGITWSKASFSNGSGSMQEAWFANGVWIGGQSNIYRSTDNGKTWTTILEDKWSWGVIYADNIWVMSGGNWKETDGIYYSEDNGLTWKQSNLVGKYLTYDYISYINGVWIAVGSCYYNGIDPPDACYSFDGKTWYNEDIPIKGLSEHPCYANGILLIGSASNPYYRCEDIKDTVLEILYQEVT